LGGRVGWKEDAEVAVRSVPCEEVFDSVSEDDVAEEEEKELDLEVEEGL